MVERDTSNPSRPEGWHPARSFPDVDLDDVPMRSDAVDMQGMWDGYTTEEHNRGITHVVTLGSLLIEAERKNLSELLALEHERTANQDWNIIGNLVGQVRGLDKALEILEGLLPRTENQNEGSNSSPNPAQSSV